MPLKSPRYGAVHPQVSMSMSMTTPDTHRDRRRSFERHLHSAMLALIVAGIIWTIQTLAQVTVDIADIRPRLTSIEVQVGGMYTAREAAGDFADVERKFGELRTASQQRDQHIKDVDDRLRVVELRTGVRR